MTVLFIAWGLGVLFVVSTILFRISCFFKKRCSWKNCPFRNKLLRHNFHIGGNLFDADCTKCPYPFDAEEERELRQIMERMERIIKEL